MNAAPSKQYLKITVFPKCSQNGLSYKYCKIKTYKKVPETAQNKQFREHFWSCYPDSNWGPHPYQQLLRMNSSGFVPFPVLFVPEKFGFSCFLFRLFRRSFSAGGSVCGSEGQFAVLRTGLTLLNFSARSAVVSGHSSSKVIGIFLALSSSLRSSAVN